MRDCPIIQSNLSKVPIRSACKLSLLILFGIPTFSDASNVVIRLPNVVYSEAITEFGNTGVNVHNYENAVYLGLFENIPDTDLYKNHFVKEEFNSTIEVLDISFGEINSLEGALPSYFGLANMKASDSDTQDLFEDQLTRDMERLDTPATRLEYIQILNENRSKVLVTSPVRGYIELNLGIESLLQREFSKALEHLNLVATGKVGSAANHRLMAMWRIAWIHHQKGDRRLAFRIYQETLRYGNEYDWVKARCYMEMAGLILEYSKNEKYGHFDIAREGIEKFISKIPKGYSEQLSTIQLMKGETYYYEQKYVECIDDLSLLVDKWKGLEQKQVAMALTFIALSKYKIGQYSDALDTLDNILQMDIPSSERWQYVPNMKIHALDWMIELAQRQGDESSLIQFNSMKNSLMEE